MPYLLGIAILLAGLALVFGFLLIELSDSLALFSVLARASRPAGRGCVRRCCLDRPGSANTSHFYRVLILRDFVYQVTGIPTGRVYK